MKEDAQIGIGKRLKEVRKYLKMNQEEFGRKLSGAMDNGQDSNNKNTSSIDKSTVSKYENGTMSISKGAMLEIISTIGVNRDWLETGEGEMFSNTEASIVSEGNLTEYLLTSTIKRLEEEVKEMKSKIEELEKNKKDK